MRFNEKLILVRAKLNISQEQLAKELGVSFSTINRWEGEKTMPTKKAVVMFNEFCKKKGIQLEEQQ